MIADECVCVCCDFGQTWSGIRTAVTFPTCHMQHRGDARGLYIRITRTDTRKSGCVCVRLLGKLRKMWGGGHVNGADLEASYVLDVFVQALHLVLRSQS